MKIKYKTSAGDRCRFKIRAKLFEDALDGITLGDGLCCVIHRTLIHQDTCNAPVTLKHARKILKKALPQIGEEFEVDGHSLYMTLTQKKV